MKIKMNELILTLKRDTVQNIICMIENYINDLYEELEMYKGSSRVESLNKYIEECKAHLNELKAAIPQEVKKEK